MHDTLTPVLKHSASAPLRSASKMEGGRTPLTNEQINGIFHISESFELPDRLMQTLAVTGEWERMFQAFLALETNMSYDWFNEYFQEQHSNRTKMMQDYTPYELCSLLPELPDSYKSVADICAGTGSLTIAAWHKHPDAQFFCVELSARAFPLLLFNLAIRNMNAIAVRMDVLSGEMFEVYKLTPAEHFSEIKKLASVPDLQKFDFVMMNPPYSLRHEWNEKLSDPRFNGYGYPPPQFSDLAFVLHGLSLMQSGGTLCAILPHGVLFRQKKERLIRQKLLESHQVSAVIGLPDNLFLNTGIPVCVLVLCDSSDLLVVDASKEFRKVGKRNVLDKTHTDKILAAVKLRANIDKFAHIADADEIAGNDYNLNIPRYVDTYEPPPLPDLVKTGHEIKRLKAEIRQADHQLLAMMKELHGEGKIAEELAQFVGIWEEMCNEYAVQGCDAAADRSGGTGSEGQDLSGGDSIHSGQCVQAVASGAV